MIVFYDPIQSDHFAVITTGLICLASDEGHKIIGEWYNLIPKYMYLMFVFYYMSYHHQMTTC